MTTETQVVKRVVAMMKADPTLFRGWSSRAMRWKIYQLLAEGDAKGGGVPYFGGGLPPRAHLVTLLAKRISKKAGQPFRRKRRGPLRAKAAGKNEVTRRVRS